MTSTNSRAAVDSPAVTEAADRLLRAQHTGTPCAPVRDLIGSDDIGLAYAVQQRLTTRRLAGGARITGRKIGLTSPAVQQQLGVDQPDFGVLFDDMAYADGSVLAHGTVLQPRVEAEVAFVLGEDLSADALDLPQIRAAIEYAVAAIEVCGSRVHNWDISFGDTVADNASAGAYVLAENRVTLNDFEPRDVEMTMTIEGQETSAGTGVACLGDPLRALQWLARQARDFGYPLRAGQVILSGALGPMRPAAPGATATATITGLGTVTTCFGGVE
jgi:2-keto-4-pentenoate hydratase